MARATKPRRETYPSARVYRAVLALRRQGRRVENYCRDRRLHVLDNAIFEERALVDLAFPRNETA